MLTYKGDVYPDLRENWKEPSYSTISTEASLNDDSNEETLNINNVCQQYCFQNMICFSWIKLISVLIHFKYWHFDIPPLELTCFPCHFYQNSPWTTNTPYQHNPHHVFYRFPYFVLAHSTTHQTICQAKPVKFIIKLYINRNTLLVKHTTYQKAESLRAASFS